jgi:very-short-patch-repair endonuclease
MRDDPCRIPPEHRDFARELRRDMTPQERVLWERLRLNRVDGLRFRRQHPFGPFILDFACLPIRLGVEVDGWMHDRAAAYDRSRDEWLHGHGWTIARFRNKDIVVDLDGVTERIARMARRLMDNVTDEGRFSLRSKSPHPSPPPCAGEGEH